MALRHWMQLALTDGIGPILSRRLVDRAGSAEAACAASTALLREVDGIGAARAQAIHDALQHAADEVESEIACATNAGVRVMSRDDAEYPLLLLQIPDPPPVLYCLGAMEPRDLHAVAIVGSRKCSLYGREQAERFGALLAGAGVTVISGGARGIDSAAHRGAMQPLNGRTIAVLGCGVDIAYPPENAALFNQIGSDGRGAVLSEYPMGTPPTAENFPRRNRIISGLSRGVLVVEADVRSGALITARQAIDDHGRTVFALPGRVDTLTSAGPHQLIRDGATLVTCLEEILSDLGPLPAAAGDVKVPAGAAPERVETQTSRPTFSDAQARIVDSLRESELSADQIIERTGLPAGQVMRELTLLSLRADVRRVESGLYAARRLAR